MGADEGLGGELSSPRCNRIYHSETEQNDWSEGAGDGKAANDGWSASHAQEQRRDGRHHRQRGQQHQRAQRPRQRQIAAGDFDRGQQG